MTTQQPLIYSPTKSSSSKRSRKVADLPFLGFPPTAERVTRQLSSDTAGGVTRQLSSDTAKIPEELAPVCLFADSDDDDMPDYEYEYVMRPITDDMRKEGHRDYPVGFCYTHLHNTTDRIINIRYFRLLLGITHYVNQAIKPDELIEIPADGSVLEFECIYNHRVICKIWQITPCENMRFLVYNREFVLSDPIETKNRLLILSMYV